MIASWQCAQLRSCAVVVLLVLTPCLGWGVTDFVAPGPRGPPLNATTHIGVYSFMRYSGNDDAAADAGKNWFVPFVVKTALLAWKDGSVLAPPERKAATTFEVLFLDECRNKVECGEAYTMNLAQRLMLGNRMVDQDFPPVKALVGGYFYTTAVARLAGANHIPNLGFSSTIEALSNKDQFPFFLRVSASEALAKYASARVLKFLNFTKALLWVCNNAEGPSQRDSFLANVGPQVGLALTPIMHSMGEVNGCQLANPALAAEYEAMVKAAKSVGAHAHIGWFGMQCPLYDLMHFLALRGLVSRGHFWIAGPSDPYMETLYLTKYYILIRFQRCNGVPSPFGSPLAMTGMDAFTILLPQQDNAGINAWWNFVQELRPKRNDTFEQWFLPTIPESAWNSMTDSTWKQPWTPLLFDAVWATMRAINGLMLEKGEAYTGQELLGWMLNDSFMGITGRVQYDANGDRLSPLNLAQFRLSGQGRRLSVSDTQPDEGYKSLSAAMRKMEEANALSLGPQGEPPEPPEPSRRLDAKPRYVIVGTYFDELKLTQPMLFYGDSPKVPPDGDLPCNPGSFYDSSSAECQLCPAGQASTLRGQSFCSDCPSGMYGATAGQSVCLACTAGSFSLEGATNCTACPAGSFTSDVQQSQCQACPSGKFSNQLRTTDCPFCPVATFQPLTGQLSCEACPEHEVTTQMGSTAASACTCAAGWYRSEGICKKCTSAFPVDTVTCAGGSTPPVVVAGFMTLDGSTDIYLCKSKNACPGSVPVGVQACAEGSTGVACSLCSSERQFDVRQGSCQECSNAGVGVFWALIGVGFVYLIVKLRPPEATYNVMSLTRTIASVFIMVPISQCGDLVQFHSILSKTPIEWPLQSGKTFEFMQNVFEFNKFSVECFLGPDRSLYPARYVALANLMPAFVICTAIIICSPVVMLGQLKGKRFPDPLYAASMSLSVILLFFLTILNLALNLVFSSYLHPDNVTRSLQNFPHIRTIDPVMHSLRGIAITAILVWCVGTFSLIAFLLYLLPRKRDNMFLRRATLPIVARYSEDKTWWLLLDMIVKILTAITLSLFDMGDVQIVWLGCIYASYFFLTCTMQPYRFARHNLLDMLLTFSKVLVIVFTVSVVAGNVKLADGVTVVSYFFYAVGSLFCLWCAVDHVRGKSADVHRDEAIFMKLQRSFNAWVPVQHQAQELVTGGEALKISSSRHHTSSGHGRQDTVGSPVPVDVVITTV